MKKFYVLLLISLLTFSPILAFATEPTVDNTNNDTNESSSTISEVVTPAVDTPEQPVPATEDSTNSNINSGTPSNIDGDELNESTIPGINSTELDGLSDIKNDSSTDDINVNALSEDGSENDNLESAHEHTFVYTSNNDGTHTITCSGQIESDSETIDCDYNEIEECSFDENGICIYCGYEKVKEDIPFEPSILVSITNQTCTIGKSYPVIRLDISQPDFDIAYAQICFANYSKNNYINVGLAQGKYLNPVSGEFEYTSNNGWYACPNLTDDLASGSYCVRSIFVRSTEGDMVHYSIESDTLSESFQSVALELKSDVPNLIPILDDDESTPIDSNKPLPEEPMPKDEPIVEEPVIEEPVKEEPVTEEPVTEEPVTEEAYNENPNIDQPSTPNNSSSTEENNTVEKSKNESNNKNEENDPETNDMLSNFFKFLRKFFGWG